MAPTREAIKIFFMAKGFVYEWLTRKKQKGYSQPCYVLLCVVFISLSQPQRYFCADEKNRIFFNYHNFLLSSSVKGTNFPRGCFCGSQHFAGFGRQSWRL